MPRAQMAAWWLLSLMVRNSWYSSPAVADLDGDNKPEVIGSPYTLFVLNGEDGTEQWSVDPPGGRTWPGVVVSDIDNNTDLEILVAQGSGYVTAYDHLGNQVWSQRPKENELRGISVYDLDADGTMEIAVTATGILSTHGCSNIMAQRVLAGRN